MTNYSTLTSREDRAAYWVDLSKERNVLVTYEWNGKKFTSQDRLNDLFLAGLLNREVTGTRGYNGFEYGQYFKFSTLQGVEIATIYKDNGYGFCSQATGVELKNAKSL